MTLLYAIYYIDSYSIGDVMFFSYDDAVDHAPDDGRYYIVVFKCYEEDN